MQMPPPFFVMFEIRLQFIPQQEKYKSNFFVMYSS